MKHLEERIMERHYQGRSSTDQPIRVETRIHELIVSLTSYPPRIGMAHRAIETLLRQTVKANRVILWLAESEFPNREKDLPEELLNLVSEGLTIEWCENLKSYKKIIPALKKYPNALICIADDDNLYSSDWLRKLYDSYLNSPNVISGARMRRIEFSSDGWVQAYGRWRLSTSSTPSFLNILTGVGGALYPPESFHEDVSREDLFMKLAPRGDDLWLWAMAVLNDRKIKATDDYEFVANPIAGSQECALWNVNGLDGENDEQLTNILENYPQLLTKLCEAYAVEHFGANVPRRTTFDRNGWSGGISSGKDELIQVLAENYRLRALMEAQKRIHRLESQNALNVRLGNIVIQSIDSRSLLSIPAQLGKIWRESSRKTSPESLGEKFGKLIAVYDQGGFAAVKKRLSDASISPVMQADAYTALA
ncbi:MAG: hypothetical protein LBD06_05545, partial [Candidatus Accumulibacter sp.]|nr:hypothetical protein [Accumulibacter sp.]